VKADGEGGLETKNARKNNDTKMQERKIRKAIKI